jgi:hypothetical protein
MARRVLGTSRAVSRIYFRYHHFHRLPAGPRQALSGTDKADVRPATAWCIREASIPPCPSSKPRFNKTQARGGQLSRRRSADNQRLSNRLAEALPATPVRPPAIPRSAHNRSRFGMSEAALGSGHSWT